MRNRNGKRNNTQNKEPAVVRCAIYTRKSTEEGLDSDFNTLDAQRESAECYINSQKGEGWQVLPDLYDDGGFTGSNMERPALRQLLEDISAGKIDCLVVYKVDRLSRSLIDFSKIIDVLDKNNISFVSVTQQFNTSNSMGRLTLNILLSFAQFEREIIAERTRDKMCAARRKGKWIGGIPMLGYDIDPKAKKLTINSEESTCVKEIFRLYIQHQSLSKLAQELNSRGWTTKSWVTKNGRDRTGKPFTKTNLHSLLTNMIYLGKVEHQGEVYKGEHEAIIEESIWSRVQQVMENNSRANGLSQRNRHGALLRGLVKCGSCNRSMYHTYTKKNSRLYRYYVCEKALNQGYKTCSTRSISAQIIETFVVDRIKQIGASPEILEDTIRKLQADLDTYKNALDDEAKYLRKELSRLKRKAGKPNRSGVGESGANEFPGEDERILACEKRLSEINRQKILLKNSRVTDRDLKKALGLFNPVWEVLFPHEQARVMNLIIDKVVYNAEKESIVIDFRPLGIQALAEEVTVMNKTAQGENQDES